jgi:hypothetical protein
MTATMSHATSILRYRFVRVSEFTSALHQNLIRAIVLYMICRDAHTGANTIERLLEFGRGEKGQATICPLLANKGLGLQAG